MREAFRRVFARRSLVFVATEKVDVTVHNGCVTVYPIPRVEGIPFVLKCGSFDPAQTNMASSGDGWLSFVLSAPMGFFAPVIGIGNEVIAVPSTGEVPNFIRSLISDPLLSPLLIEEEYIAEQNLLKDYLAKLPPDARKAADSARDLAVSAASNMALQHARRWQPTPKNGVDVFTDPDRFSVLFGDDLTAFRRCVALGLLRDIDVLMPSTIEFLVSYGVDPRIALLDATNIANKFGIALIRRHGHYEWLL